MERKLRVRLILFVLLFSFFNEFGIQTLLEDGVLERLDQDTVISSGFRDHILNEEIISYMKKDKKAYRTAGLYLLESKFSYRPFSLPYSEATFDKLYRKWKKKKEWKEYEKTCSAIWNDLQYFPVPILRDSGRLLVSYQDSWMNERTYGGRRGHEGTDLMADKDIPGLYPVVSITDGVIKNKGWLEKGGYRIGILSPSGGYFYYAHLDSYTNVKEGDKVQAGQILGYMGNTGYGKEGTKGKFPVHLHLGIYIQHNQEEVSINPYWILKYLESCKRKTMVNVKS